MVEILDTDDQPQWADTLHDPQPEEQDYAPGEAPESVRETPEPVPVPTPSKPRPLRGEALITVSHTVMQSLGVTSESATFPEIEAAMPGKLLEPKSPAIFDPKTDKVWVNTDAPYWSSPARTLKLSKQQNWFAVNTPEQVAYHEAVHSLHFRKILAAEGGDRERAIKRMGRMSLNEFPIPLRRTIQKEVGRYAALNESEFVAEVGGAIRQGETYSEPIMSLYRELLGP